MSLKGNFLHQKEGGGDGDAGGKRKGETKDPVKNV